MSFDTLNSLMAIFTDGNGNKWYKAKVITNVDPDNLDRIQVQLPGLYDQNLGPVPWCGPMKMTPFGFGSGYGVFGTPVVGSDVMISLQDGNPHYPVYMHVQCWPNPDEFPSGQAWGFKDPDGNALVVQGKDIQFKSGGGFQMHIDESGNFTVSTPDGGTGTYNVPHLVYNVTDFTINGATTVNGATTINGAFTAEGTAAFDQLATFLSGINVTGAIMNNGHNLGNTHRHTGGTETGGLTGTVST
jgi:Type VI secretion system/phage-baseplate injector OB domain